MSKHHDDFATEPLPGLPAKPPIGEEVLWQGRPATYALAREAMKIHWIAGYFVGLAVWRAAVASDGTSLSVLAVMLPYLGLGLIACLMLLAAAALQARSTVYTLTSARVAMRIGAALCVTLNLPYRQIGAASLVLRRDGTGTIALETLGETRISYLVCWPHVRPWHFARTQPTLRCIPDAAKVAKILAEAAETRLNEPLVVRAEPGLTLVAAE